MIVLIYNNLLQKFERYSLESYDPMPYTTHNNLSVASFRASSRSHLLWTTRRTMETWNALCLSCQTKPTPLSGFRRICEGGHPPESPHYAGVALKPAETSLPSPAYGYPMLALGATGIYVLVLQDALFTCGITSCALDGFFGPLTRQSLMEFQESFNLPISGIADRSTWRALTFRAAGAGQTGAVPFLPK